MSAAIPQARWRYLPDLLDRHAQDLGFLWGQCRNALTSTRHTAREYGEIRERMEAHTQGLLVAPTEVLANLLQPLLDGDDEEAAFAAATAMRRTGDARMARSVLQAFERAREPALRGLRGAASLAPLDGRERAFASLLAGADATLAASAAIVLANHGALDDQDSRLESLLIHEDVDACTLAWRSMVLAVSRSKRREAPRLVAQASTSPGNSIRSAAWACAAWTADPHELRRLPKVAGEGDPVGLAWLAVLGGPGAVEIIQAAARSAADPAACELLARHGHPSSLPLLLEWIDAPPSPRRVAAGEAFSRITGCDIRGHRAELPVDDDADDFARAMAPLVWLPDPAAARAAFNRRRAEWDVAGRWCKGVRMDVELAPAQVAALDLQARWDAGARAAATGRRLCAPAPVY